MRERAKTTVLILSIISGILLTIAWPLNGLPVFLLIGFIPLLIAEEQIFKFNNKYSKFAVLFYSYPGFFLWNILTTYWIYHATIVGMLIAVTFNSLFMALIFQLFHYCKKVLYKKFPEKSDGIGYFILISFWLSFEFLHLNWELSWTWLQLGNGFANAVKFIQWYEYTGVLGGTLWILLINILLYKIYLMFKFSDVNKKKKNIFSVITSMIILIPVLFSLVKYYNYKEKENPIDVLIIQPNIDPYNEKFIHSAIELNNRLISIAEQKLDEKVDFIVAPETAIQEPLWINDVNNSRSVEDLRNMLRRLSPDAKINIGASTYLLFEPDDKPSATARSYRSYDGYYFDAFNTSLLLDTSKKVQICHKIKLVAGSERMPYSHLFSFLEKYALDLGGITGSLGTSDKPVIFTGGKVPVASLICYESIYGEFSGKFIIKGAELIFIITNDGWWYDTPGPRQHMIYATLRAIEARRSIARSANTGISCFINQRGDIFQSTKYWEEDVIRQKINANNKLTIYVKFGDYLGRMSLLASIGIILITLVRCFTKRKKYNLTF